MQQQTTYRVKFYGGPCDGHERELEQPGHIVWLPFPGREDDPGADVAYRFDTMRGGACRYVYARSEQ